ncbi:MAG: DUF4292 domain-containing protein [Smithellaceae bacterium]
MIRDLKLIASLLLFLMLICGCVRQVVVPDARPENVLAGIVQPVSGTDRMVGIARIDVMTAEGHYPVRAALVFRKPAYLRLELLPVIGTPDFFLAATPEAMNIFIPSRAVFYTGKPTADHLARFLPWSLDIADLVTILCGSYPALSGQIVSYAYEQGAKEGVFGIKMRASSGASQLIWVDAQGKLAGLLRFDEAGKEIYQVLYEDYSSQMALPGRITIKTADNQASVSIKYADMKIETTDDFSVFDLMPPPGVKIIFLE